MYLSMVVIHCNSCDVLTSPWYLLKPALSNLMWCTVCFKFIIRGLYPLGVPAVADCPVKNLKSTLTPLLWKFITICTQFLTWFRSVKGGFIFFFQLQIFWVAVLKHNKWAQQTFYHPVKINSQHSSDILKRCTNTTFYRYFWYQWFYWKYQCQFHYGL